MKTIYLKSDLKSDFFKYGRYFFLVPTLIFGSLQALFSSTAYASETEITQHKISNLESLEKKWGLKVGFLLGVLGGGAEIGLPISANKVVRIKWQKGNTGERQTNSGIAFSEKFQAKQVGLYLDWHSWNTGFRGTLGITSNKNLLEGVANNSSQLILGNNSYTPTELQTLNYQATYGNIGAYVGFGWSLVPTQKNTWFVTLDTGLFLQTRPKINLEATKINSSINHQLLEENINLEREQIRNNIDHLTLLPTYTIGVSRSF